MRVFKLFFLSVFILFVVVTVISLFIPSHIRISRALDILASRERVHELVSKPANWRYWYPGVDSARPVHTGGGVIGWELDRNTSLVMKTFSDSSVTAEFQRGKMRSIETVWNFISANDSSAVTVQWYMDFHLKWYPWEKFKSLMFDKVYGQQLESGLSSLKKTAEGSRSYN